MVYKRKTSVSQINLYHSCPKKWYLKYKRGIKEPSTTALVKGSLVHATIEQFYGLNVKECGITLKNYKTEFPNYIIKVFDEVLIAKRQSFGKDVPTFKEELKALCSDEFEYAKEIVDARTIIRNYMQLFLTQFEQYAQKNEYFNRAWYSCRLKFSELELNTDSFLGFVDGVIEKDGSLIIVDWKTSGMYKSLGYSSEYELQVKIYAAMYYKIHGVIPDYGCIVFCRYGIQCFYPINKDTIVEEVDKIISDFMINTQSDDENNYKPNYNYQFCTCNMSKNKGKGWCFYQDICNSYITGD